MSALQFQLAFILQCLNIFIEPTKIKKHQENDEVMIKLGFGSMSWACIFVQLFVENNNFELEFSNKTLETSRKDESRVESIEVAKTNYLREVE